MASMRLVWICVLVFVLGCSGRRSGGGGGGGGGGASEDWIAAYSACTGAGVEDMWASELAARTQSVPPAFAGMVSCMESASDCDEVLECVGFALDEPCDSYDYREACEGGTVRTDCQELEDGRSFVMRVDCRDMASGNDACLVDDGDYPTCAAGSCGTADGYSCDDDEVVECLNGLEYRRDCSETGKTCILTEDGYEGWATCGFAGESCTRDSCDGDTVIFCDSTADVVVERLDCGDLVAGATCIDSGDGPRCWMPSGEEECDLWDTRCEGSVARTCVAGKWFDVDCSSFHGADCAVGDDGVGCFAAE